MSYVLERDFANTNFMQNKMIASNTNAIALHSDQLVKAGQDLTYFDQNIYDNINFNIDRLNNLQAQINEAKDERDTIQTKISNIGSGMGSGDCAFWDVPCKMKETTSQIGTIALLAGGGFVLYKVLSGRRKLL